ncbi:Outer membrane protein assembly factor BamB, contains PQQ-like beta-propeller repeat [Halogranum amylolyticum]|uniref:Outer membrane protein assembly factor BamB, contains PQQ-like beta-propeller repeat n=1 Tax=Halogranum amylolyticum TaxID=660520 RepID=A0A1H8TR08_9EURY|nr:PQQ-binding-like beta-propeller repeat protein [Halogranum amylolyticum]SEO93301.1 Outer membrane protein assembly factor BamB, contains PQQ-like beta-propeller repeat [Halogranum amylolyticum]
MSSDRSSRRGFLALVGGAAAAGCATLPSSDDSTATTSLPPTSAPLGDAPPEGSWPTLDRDAARTGFDPTTAAAAEPALTWRRSLAGPATSPVVVGDTLYLTRGVPADRGAEATLEAFALESGERRWSESLGVRFSDWAQPVYHRGVLFVATGGAAFALDADSRERYWRTVFEDRTTTDTRGRSDTEHHKLEGPIAATDDGVFVSDISRALVCLNRDGTERWRWGSRPYVHRPPPVVDAVSLDGKRRWARETFTDGGLPPVVADDRLYVADDDGNAAAFDLESGQRVWGTELYDEVDGSGRPTLVDGAFLVCYVVDGRVTLTALDTESGDRRWRLARHAVGAGGPVASNGWLTFVTRTTERGGDRWTDEPAETTSSLYGFSASATDDM